MSTSSSAELPAGWAAPFYAGKRVLVVGAASGIGAGLARGFAGAGAAVIASGRNEAERATIAADPALAGATALAVDVRDGEAVKTAIAGLGTLDVLVVTAGIIQRDAEHEPETFDAVLDVNLSGSMRCCAAARPLLAASGHGAILLTASMLSFFGGARVPGYAASKGGIAQLTKSLALAYAGENIRVNALAPGWIATALTAELQADPSRSAALLGRTPLARWGTPEDLVPPALFLCSPLAGFVTGTIMPVDGGYAAA
jgi:NAD(P)-dependent dehydrogenase (short-subunit alcohol dehydrogenase family)